LFVLALRTGGHARLERAPGIRQRGDMRVRVDESGHDVTSADVDHRCARGRVEWLAFNLSNPSVANDHGRVCRDRSASAVGNVGMTQHDDRQRLLRAGGGRKRKR
jgi:hypothetical protein